MDALTKLSRNEQITGAAAVLLLIGILAFPWYSISIPGFKVGNTTVVGGTTYTATALHGYGTAFAVLALLVLIVLVAWFALARFSTVQLPQLPVPPLTAELAAAGAVAALLVLKLITHIGDLGWGCYLELLLAAAMVWGASQTFRQGSSAALRPGLAEPGGVQ